MKTLEMIIAEEKKIEKKNQNGDFGIIECKKAIEWDKKYFKKSYFVLLEEYLNKVNSNCCYNQTMVYACWLLINGR